MEKIDELREGSFREVLLYFYDFKNWSKTTMLEHPVELYTYNDVKFNGFTTEIVVNHGISSLKAQRMLLEDVNHFITQKDGTKITDEYLKSVGAEYSRNTGAFQLPPIMGTWTVREPYYFIYVPALKTCSSDIKSQYLKQGDTDLVYFCPVSPQGTPQIDKLNHCPPAGFKAVFDTSGFNVFKSIKPASFCRIRGRAGITKGTATITHINSTELDVKSSASLEKEQLPEYVEKRVRQGTLSLQEFTGIVKRLLPALGAEGVYESANNKGLCIFISGIPIEVSCNVGTAGLALKFTTINGYVIISDTEEVIKFLKCASTVKNGSITARALQSVPNKFKTFAKRFRALTSNYYKICDRAKAFIADEMPSQAAIDILNNRLFEFKRQLDFAIPDYVSCLYTPSGTASPEDNIHSLVGVGAIDFETDNSLSQFPSLGVEFSFFDRASCYTFTIRVRDILTTAWLEAVVQNGRVLYSGRRPTTAPDYFALTSITLLNRLSILYQSGAFREIALAFDLIQRRKEL